MKKGHTLSDLNDYLFEQLDRLNNKSMSDDKLMSEMERAKSIGNIAKDIINNGRLILDSKKHFDELGIKIENQPNILKIEDTNDSQ